MAITYGQIKNDVLKLIDNYSSRGAPLSASKIADYNMKIRSLVNSTIYDLASTTARIPAVFRIAHNPVKNTLADDTSSIKTHLPGVDFSISLVNARATFFEATAPAAVIIEESANNGASYSTIETITVTASVTTLIEYRRLISPSSSTNIVRLRFSGDSLFSFSNYILYPYSWPTESDVQQHRPWFEFPLPNDFFDINNVFAKKDARQFVPYMNYIITPDKKISFNSYDYPMELLINYWRRPNLLTFTGVDATDDAQTIDLTDDAAIIIPWFVAGDILNSEQLLAEGTLRLNQATVKKNSLIGSNRNTFVEILNVTGW